MIWHARGPERRQRWIVGWIIASEATGGVALPWHGHPSSKVPGTLAVKQAIDGQYIFRYYGLDAEMYDKTRWDKSGGWNPDYIASFERDIEPIIKRQANYQWVANVPTMTAFSAPPFNPRDSSSALLTSRKTYFIIVTSVDRHLVASIPRLSKTFFSAPRESQ